MSNLSKDFIKNDEEILKNLTSIEQPVWILDTNQDIKEQKKF